MQDITIVHKTANRITNNFSRMNNIQKALLAAASLGSLTIDYYAGILLPPDMARALRRMRAPSISPEEDPERVRQSIYALKRGEYLKVVSVGKKKFKLELTDRGKQLFKNRSFYDITIPHPQKWDGSWRLVAFDIPEKYRWTRDALRERLKSLGFFRFQKSFWIYPFECEKEVNFLCDHLGIQHYVLVFTGKLVNDGLLCKYFLREKVFREEDLRP